MDQSAYTRKLRDSTRASGPRGPQASPYRDSAGSFMVSVAGGAAYVGCTNCDANAPDVPSATVPDAPTDVSGTRGPGQVTVAFVPPVNDGGSAILYYTVLTTSGVSGETIPDVSGLSSPIIVSGLTNGAPYGFRVTATNSVGTSVPSAASDPVIPATVPSAPTIGTATGGNAQATVTFSAPASTGGSPITAYRATSNPGGFTADASASPITVTGLTNGTPYTFRVTAINDVGTSPASAASNSAIPSGPPAAPTGLSGVGGNQAIYVLFTQPVAPGGSPITNYEYSIDGGATFTAFGPAQTTSPVEISGVGLSNGTPYTVQLKAVNANGTSAASSSVSVTPTVNTLSGGAPRLIYLDASNAASYPGSGTAWGNLGSGGPPYTATLVGTPIFNSTSKYFTFDGVSQMTQIAAAAGINPTVGSSFTLQVWARVNTASPNFTSGDGLISKQYGFSSYDGYSLSLSADTRVFLNMNGQSVNANYASGTGAYSNGWALYTIVVRFGGGAGNPSYTYVSTRRVLTGNNGDMGIPSNNAPLQFPRGIQDTGANFCPADVAEFYLYNTALSQEDIIRNYDANRGRYSLAPQSVPGVPTGASAVAGNGQATVSFTAPTSDGGSPITSYRVTSSPGNITASGASSPITVTGLTNGTPYTFTVVATNAIGDSPASAVTSAVTPSVITGSPRVLILGDASITAYSTNLQAAKTALGYDGTMMITTKQLNDPTYTGAADLTTTNYDVVIIFTNGGLAYNAALGTNLNNYVTSGGHLVMNGFSWGNVSAITNFTYATNSTYAYNGSFTTTSVSSSFYPTAHPITKDISTTTGMSSQNIPNPIALTAGATAIAQYTSGSGPFFIAVKQVGPARLVGINAYISTFVGSTNVMKLALNSIFWCIGALD